VNKKRSSTQKTEPAPQPMVANRRIDYVVESELRLGLPAAALLLAFQAFYDAVVLGPHGTDLVKMTLVSALLCVIAWLILRTRAFVFPRRILAAIVVSSIVGLQIAHYAYTGSLGYSLATGFVHLGAGYLMIWPRWGIALSAISSFAWLAVTLQFDAPPEGMVALAAALVPFLCTAPYISMVRIAAVSNDSMTEAELAEGAENAIRRNQHLEARLQLIQGAGDGHWFWDLKTDNCTFSDQWTTMLDFKADEIPGRLEAWFNRIHPHYLPQVKEDLSAHLYGQTPRFQSQYRIQKRDGSYIWVLSRGTAKRDSDGNPIAMAGLQTDVTHLIVAEKQILDDAFQDRLTGLANRKAFMVRLERALEESQNGGSLFAVIFMDLDRFKIINDTHGHMVGDQLLAATAARLRSCLREKRGDILARFGGDEFVVLLEELREPENAIVVAQRFQRALRPPVQIGEHELSTGVSIGIAFSNTGVQRAEDLLRNADTAMYRAKATRKGEIMLFNNEMHEETVEAYSMENDLSKALARGEFFLHYQPLLTLSTGRIIGAEALIRWQRTPDQVVSPADFIPLAEETGSIEAIGEWALREACRQTLAWQNAGHPSIRIAVNLSAKQLQLQHFPDTVERVLSETGLSPTYLDLELTETALMLNLEEASKLIDRLRRLGVSIAIDDFGTGYSSLGYLRTLSFNSLKIDRSFVADLTVDAKARAVAEGLIDLAHKLRLKVTAEGVETPEQLSYLSRSGCDYFQGFLASRPVAAERFEAMLRHDPQIAKIARALQAAPKTTVSRRTERRVGPVAVGSH
jgi:diguanylate cyclase (GGDEF)-like protein/PAS domain S-box-containing protein